MFINRYDPIDPGRSRIISNGHYQKQAPRSLNFNNNPTKPATKLEKKPEDEIKLSKENKNRADNLTNLTLKKIKFEKNEKKSNKNTGLDYFI
ncbi:MAG TPA: hypothetical protein DDW90_03935 [Cyanobacteria bacterium UBA9971]|nr:hypothetical protein [Cyanobacteria bacterium UBA9971]